MISILKREHEDIKSILLALESAIGKNISYSKIKIILNKLNKIWMVHEEREEKSLDWLREICAEFPEKMLLEEHRELRGHWKVLKKSINLLRENLDTALDTDGRMLIEKFRKHIEFEDNIFDKALKSKI